MCVGGGGEGHVYTELFSHPSDLQASEALLAPGALVIADNAGVFKDGGLKPYLGEGGSHITWGRRRGCLATPRGVFKDGGLKPYLGKGEENDYRPSHVPLMQNIPLRHYLPRPPLTHTLMPAEYVRGSPQYDSTFIESTLEWWEDVPDGIEVSIYRPMGTL